MFLQCKKQVGGFAVSKDGDGISLVCVRASNLLSGDVDGVCFAASTYCLTFISCITLFDAYFEWSLLLLLFENN